MKPLAATIGFLAAAILGFLLTTGVMTLVERWTGRTPEEIGILYGLAQIVLWAAFTSLLVWGGSKLGRRPSRET